MNHNPQLHQHRVLYSLYTQWEHFLHHGGEMPSVALVAAAAGEPEDIVRQSIGWAIEVGLLSAPKAVGLPPAPTSAGTEWFLSFQPESGTAPEAAPEAAKPKKRTPKPKPEPEPETHAEDAATYVIDSNEAAYIAQAHERREREEIDRIAMEQATNLGAAVTEAIFNPQIPNVVFSPYSEVAVTPAPAPPPKPRKLIEVLAARHMIEPGKFYDLVRNQLINTTSNEPPATPEEVALVMHTMHKYDLDPIVNQVYAFRSKGKLRVVVGYDGRVKVASRDHEFLGVTYEEGTIIDAGEIFPALKGKGIKVCEYIRATFNHVRRKPTTITVWLREWMLPNVDNWVRYPNHRLRCKAYSSIIREVYALGAADDEDYLQMTEGSSQTAAITSSTAVRGVEELRKGITGG